MSVARAKHYPQPPPAAEVLAGVRCEHGELEGRCALCRLAAEPPDDQAPPEPTETRPPAPPVVDNDDQDPRNTPWWDR